MKRKIYHLCEVLGIFLSIGLLYVIFNKKDTIIFDNKSTEFYTEEIKENLYKVNTLVYYENCLYLKANTNIIIESLPSEILEKGNLQIEIKLCGTDKIEKKEYISNTILIIKEDGHYIINAIDDEDNRYDISHFAIIQIQGEKKM